MLLYDWSSRMSIALISQESWERGQLQPLEPPFLLWQIHPSWAYSKKITSRREDLMGCPSHPPVNDFKRSSDNMSMKGSSMLAVTQPCGTLCVPPLTPIHPAEMVGTALVPNFNSDITFREVSPSLKSKINAKTQTHSWMLVFPETAPSQPFLSLTCFIYSHFVPSWQGTGCVESGGWPCVWGTVRCLYPALDEIRTAKLCVLDLLYFKGCIRPWDLYFWSKYIYFSGFYKIRCWYWMCSQMRYWKPIPLLQFLCGLRVLRTGSQHAAGQQLWRLANLTCILHISHICHSVPKRFTLHRNRQNLHIYQCLLSGIKRQMDLQHLLLKGSEL